MSKNIIIASIFFVLQADMLCASSLRSFVEIALEHNMALKSEYLSLSKEEIGLNRANKEEFYPEVNLELDWSKSWGEEFEGFFWMGDGGNEKPTMNINSFISRTHPFGGKLRLNLSTNQMIGEKIQNQWDMTLDSEEPLSKSARQIIMTPLFDEQLQFDTAKLNLQERISEIIFDVINLYTQLQRLDFTLSIKTKELENLQGNIEISRIKLEKGLIPEMDIFQMELQTSSVLSEMETIKKDKRGQIARFLQILGIQSTIEDMQNSQEDFLNKIKVLKRLVEPYSQPLGTRSVMSIPQVKIKYIQIELSKRRLQEAVSRNAPVLIPAVTVNRSGNTTQEEFRASVKFPLYNKGIKKEETKIAQASLSQTELELKSLLINTQIDIATTLDEIKDTERRIEVLDKDIDLSEKIYEIAMIKYQRGLISAKDLLQYQADVFRKRKSIFEEQTELFLDYVKLLKITGELYHAYQKDIF